jgi:hypothetical protein
MKADPSIAWSEKEIPRVWACNRRGRSNIEWVIGRIAWDARLSTGLLFLVWIPSFYPRCPWLSHVVPLESTDEKVGLSQKEESDLTERWIFGIPTSTDCLCSSTATLYFVHLMSSWTFIDLSAFLLANTLLFLLVQSTSFYPFIFSPLHPPQKKNKKNNAKKTIQRKQIK